MRRSTIFECPRWIPVSERLPDTDEIVATLYANGDRHGYDQYEDGVWVGYENELEEYQSIRCAEMTFGCAPPTHWMPLPDAPQSASSGRPQELETALALASTILALPYEDPDSDRSILARQLLRSNEACPGAEYVGGNCPKCGTHDVPGPRGYELCGAAKVGDPGLVCRLPKGHEGDHYTGFAPLRTTPADPRDYWAQHPAAPYVPPSDEAVQRVIDAARASGMPMTALRWAIHRLDADIPGEAK